MYTNVTTVTPRYKLLKPVQTVPPSILRYYNTPLSPQQLDRYILNPASSDLLALDLETRGLSPFYPHVYKKGKEREEYEPLIMGIGFAYRDSRGQYRCSYVNMTVQPKATLIHLCKRLGSLHLVAHNTMFDGLWLRHLGLSLGVDVRPNWVADTYGLFKQLAGQDFIGQSHGLKDAQVNLLGWDAKGDVELDESLIDLGFYRESGKKGQRVKKAMKGEMWRSPFNTLAKYCMYDSGSTLQLFDKIFEPPMQKFPMLWDYHEGALIRTIQELIDQQIRGLRIDVPGMTQSKQDIEKTIADLSKKFYTLPEVVPFLEKWRSEKIAKINIPTKLTKTGKLTVAYKKYSLKVSALLLDPTYGFNLASDKQVRWLFYDNMYTYKTRSEEFFGREKVTYILQGSQGEVELPGTESGASPVDKNALPHFGEAGAILKEIAGHTKVLEYINSYLDLLVEDRLHPGWKVPGTLTDRVSGANPNMLQIAKDPRKLKYIIPDEGYIFGSADFSSLENVVLAELSRDKSLLYLYGPGALENCGYLYTGAHVAGLKEVILQYYDPNNPTPEGIALAKKHAKRERSIAKVVVLSSQYGASAGKIYQTLKLQGVDITYEQVVDIHANYWKLYEGVAHYAEKLKEEWKRNRGYIINGLGKPMTVGDHHLKDLVNRSCQSTGAGITMRWTATVADLVKERGIDAHPSFYNFHDETIWNVKPEHWEQLKQVYLDACQIENDRLTKLGWECKLRVDPSVGNNLWEIKSE